MRKGIIIVTALIFSMMISGCACIDHIKRTFTHRHADVRATPSKPPKGPFDQVCIDASVDVEILSTRYPQYSVTVTGDTQHNLDITISNHVLKIQTKHYKMAHRPLVKIRMGQIHALHYDGAGTVRGRAFSNGLVVDIGKQGNLYLDGTHICLLTLTARTHGDIIINGIVTPCLDVCATGTRNLKLNGNNIPLRSLKYSGEGHVSVMWVNSRRVIVTGKERGYIFLAGVSDVLDAVLYDATVLDARYLRVNRAFIHTYNSAMAKVYVRDTLYAYASGSSSIYYYRMPHFIGTSIYGSGVILYMTEKLPPCPPLCATVPFEPG